MDELLSLLGEWELRGDHKIDGYSMTSGSIEIYYDKSGYVIAELSTISDDPDRKAAALKTAIGFVGMCIKKIPFENLAECRSILSRPLELRHE